VQSPLAVLQAELDIGEDVGVGEGDVAVGGDSPAALGAQERAQTASVGIYQAAGDIGELQAGIESEGGGTASTEEIRWHQGLVRVQESSQRNASVDLVVQWFVLQRSLEAGDRIKPVVGAPMAGGG
jgi:hypothetical protein